MPFLFSYVCDLLQRIEDNQNARTGVKTNATIVQDWFRHHQAQLLRDDFDIAALLSTLLPEKRTDRVYCIRERTLQTIIGRGLILGCSRIKQLGRWSDPNSTVDIAQCVEGILKETPNPVAGELTVEEIDGRLHEIAAACRFSSPAVRRSVSGLRITSREEELGDLYKRVSARDAKWLTRLILKNYEPVVLDPQLIFRNYHPFLPSILKVQDDLVVASRILANVQRDRTVTGRASLAKYLKPALGVKIGRQPWFKGRSIKHCLNMSHGRMSCEEKLDGEYCQIHIDLSKGRDCIQIFSKSGKDSTMDRIGLHDSIRRSLQLGQPSCSIKKGCILEGELVVYSDKDAKILDFHKIRKYVSRSGTFIGVDQDSQRHPWDHLMIVYYDLFMLDDESLLATKHSERFDRLKGLITPITGRSALVNRHIIDCDRPSAASDLRRVFAECIVARGEGLVLKPDDPYFNFDSPGRPYHSVAIKMKKDYIGNFGEIGDFAVVGSRLDPAKAKTYQIPNLKWTHFYIGCLENKDEVKRFDRKPKFIVTNVVELNSTQLKEFSTAVNPPWTLWEENTSISIRMEPGIDNGKRPAVVFTVPPVFDIRCFSFDKNGNTGFWSPRFPSVSKIHCDRTFEDTLSFKELQEMAVQEREMPPPDDSQELLGWIAALEEADPGAKNTEGISQVSVSTYRPCEASTSQASTSQASTSRASVPPPARVANEGEDDSTIPRSQEVPVVDPAALSPPSSPATVRGPLTPPRSSANTGTKESPIVLDDEPAKQPSPGRKRPLGPTTQEASQITKARRRSQEQVTVKSPSPPAASTASAPNRRRDPLTNVPQGSPRRNQSASFIAPRLTGVESMYQPTSSAKDPEPLRRTASSFPASLSFHESASSFHLPRTAATQPAATSFSASDSGSRPRLSFTNPSQSFTGGCCQFMGTGCTLSGYTFLLSPCIAGYLYVTEDLLASHGVTEFARDPKEWSGGETGRTRARRGKKMIVLVDSKRKGPTAAFLERIREVGLKRRNGERRYVQVFDWRVLEKVKGEEERCGKGGRGVGRLFDMNHEQGVWRGHWVGLA
ncbi:hypothetical protein QBC39DRAFT_401706 [Podospora conica]|nr:hypothetical protein QBC39DRAFT_401706 [Schizothecium conicum]